MASFNSIRLLAKPFVFSSYKADASSAHHPAFAGPLKAHGRAPLGKNIFKQARLHLPKLLVQTPARTFASLKTKAAILARALGLDGAFVTQPARRASVLSVASAHPRHAMELSRGEVETIPTIENAFRRRSAQVDASFSVSRNASDASSRTSNAKATALVSKAVAQFRARSEEVASFDNWDTSGLSAELPFILEEMPASPAAPGVMASRNAPRPLSALLTLPAAPFRQLDKAAASQDSISRYSSLPPTPRSVGSLASQGARRHFLGSTANNSEETLATKRTSVSSEDGFRVKSDAFSLDDSMLERLESSAASSTTLVDSLPYVLPPLKFDTSSLFYAVLMTPGSPKRQNTTGGRIIVAGSPFYEWV